MRPKKEGMIVAQMRKISLFYAHIDWLVHLHVLLQAECGDQKGPFFYAIH